MRPLSSHLSVSCCCFSLSRLKQKSQGQPLRGREQPGRWGWAERMECNPQCERQEFTICLSLETMMSTGGI